MDNFNNKTNSKQNNNNRQYACSQRVYTSDTISQQNIRKQGNATQFLLMLSQLQERQKKYYTQENEEQVIDVAPWADQKLAIRRYKKKAQNSKTSIILPPCQFIQNQQTIQQKQPRKEQKPLKFETVFKKKNNYKRKSKDNYNKQNKQNILSKLEIIMINNGNNNNGHNNGINSKNEEKKNNKNSSSAVARYSQYCGDWRVVCQNNFQNQQRRNNYTDYTGITTNNNNQSQKSNCRSIASFYNPNTIKPNHYKHIHTNKQNQTTDICMIPRLEHYCSRSSTTHTNQKKHIKTSPYSTNNSASLTNPVLRKNTGLLTEPITKFVDFHLVQGRRDQYCEYQEKGDRDRDRDYRNMHLNLKQRKEQNSNNPATTVSLTKKQVIQKLNGQYKTIVQQHSQNNNNKDIRNNAPQYQKIKKQILSNTTAQKQSMFLKMNLPYHEKNSKKLLGRYFKYSMLKKERNFINGNGGNGGNSRPEVLGEVYQASNPITKHLYDKYKKIMARNSTK